MSSKARNSAVETEEVYTATAGVLIDKPGNYPLEVVSVLDDESKEGTPQVRIVAKVSHGDDKGQMVSIWQSKIGYKKDAKGNFVLDKNKQRTEDPDNTAACKRIIGQIGMAMGIEKDQNFKLSELRGRTFGARVAIVNGSPRVERIMSTEALEKKSKAIAEANSEFQE